MAVGGDYAVTVDGGQGGFVLADGDCGRGFVSVSADGFVVGFGGSGC